MASIKPTSFRLPLTMFRHDTTTGVTCMHLSFLFLFLITFIEPHGATHGELNQPSPQFQADRPQSVKVYGHIEGHSNLMLNANFTKGSKFGGPNRC